MDITKLPRELVYKEKSSVNEFEYHPENKSVWKIHSFIMEYSETLLYKKNDELLSIMPLNDAYYICTLVLIDNNPVNHFVYYTQIANREQDAQYINQIVYSRMVMTVVYTLLIRIARRKIKVRRFCNKLESYVYDKSIFTEKGNYMKNYPDMFVFSTRVIEEDIVKKINWDLVTSHFKLSEISEIIDKLGKNNKGKRLLIQYIYLAEIASSSMYNIPYEVDRFLLERYQEYGGNNILKDFNKNDKDKKEVKAIFYKEELEKENKKLSLQNLELTNENKSLKMTVADLQKKVIALKNQLDYHASREQEKSFKEMKHHERQAELEAKLEEMNGYIETLKERIVRFKETHDNIHFLDVRFAESDICKKLHSIARYGQELPSKNDWENLKNLIDAEIPSFYAVVNHHQNLKEQEYQICMLIRTNFQKSEICNLMNMSSANLSMLRKRLLVKIFATEGSAKEFDAKVLNIF